MLRNRAFNRTRDEARRRARHAAAGAGAAAAAAVGPEELLGRIEVQRLLAEAVVALREPLRQTVLLRYYEELSVRADRGPVGRAGRHCATAVERGSWTSCARGLDQGHDGQREAWLRALIPLAPELGRVQGTSACAPG